MFIALVLVSIYAYAATGYILFKREAGGDESLGEKVFFVAIWPALGVMYISVGISNAFHEAKVRKEESSAFWKRVDKECARLKEAQKQ